MIVGYTPIHTRKCMWSGRGMSQGFLYDGDKTFADEASLLGYLRANGCEEYNSLSDDGLIEECYTHDLLTWTEWLEFDDNTAYLDNGTEIKIQQCRIYEERTLTNFKTIRQVQ